MGKDDVGGHEVTAGTVGQAGGSEARAQILKLIVQTMKLDGSTELYGYMLKEFAEFPISVLGEAATNMIREEEHPYRINVIAAMVRRCKAILGDRARVDAELREEAKAKKQAEDAISFEDYKASRGLPPEATMWEVFKMKKSDYV